ncbi:hypothetical protein ACFVT2_00705 [Streptomyces sp. NPDC058000]|uniref:hypothetical protein n=1 Tax=Streptomyces sp. NPDC058000 TaxID=3346299 RepID=UPI0036E3647E
MRYRADVTVRCPDGASIELGGLASSSPRRAVGWVRRRAVHMAQQLGAPYEGGVRAWLDGAGEFDGAVDALAGGSAVALTVVDGEGCAYALVARPVVATLEVAA